MEGMTDFQHLPVMAREVVELLGPVPAGLIVDGTVGGGGHASLILGARPDCHLLGIDRDGDAVLAARERLAPYGSRARVVRGGFEDIAEIVSAEGEGNVMGVLFDLGVSSPQLDRGSRGFSYMADAPLDMRMDARQALTAALVVNEYDEADLARIIGTFGEERHARSIARSIVARRPLLTTGDLVAAITAAIPGRLRRTGPHPARRTFQAIRMEVNRELEHLEQGLDEAVYLLKPEGRVLVLAYHSLEDRIVKERFRDWSATHEAPALPGLPAEPVERIPVVRTLTRRALRPAPTEVEDNPRSRSVRLRAAERSRVRPAGGSAGVVSTRAAAPTRRRTTDTRTPTRPAARSTARPAARPAARTTTRPAPRPTGRGAPPRPAGTAARGRTASRGRAVGMLVVAVGIMLTVVVAHTLLAQNQVRLDRLESRIAAEETRYDSLRLANGQLSSPARITARAAQLGLALPTEPPVAVPVVGDVPRRGSTDRTCPAGRR